VLRRTNLAFLALLLCTVQVVAAPPPGADPNSKIAHWVHTAKDFRGTPCCDEADCRQTAVRVAADGRYEVWIGEEYGYGAPNAWMPVSDKAMASTADGPPPDGRAWACFWGGEVRCFFSDGAS
jgi:hypothetical protein